MDVESVIGGTFVALHATCGQISANLLFGHGPFGKCPANILDAQNVALAWHDREWIHSAEKNYLIASPGHGDETFVPHDGDLQGCRPCSGHWQGNNDVCFSVSSRNGTSGRVIVIKAGSNENRASPEVGTRDV